MLPLDVNLDITVEPWDEVRELVPERSGTLTKIGLLPGGSVQGKATVVMVVVLPDGTLVIAQTTWRLLSAAYFAMAASPLIAKEELWNNE